MTKKRVRRDDTPEMAPSELKKVLEIIEGITNCTSLDGLKKFLREVMLKQFRSQAYAYCWTSPKALSLKNMGASGFNQEQLKIFESIFPIHFPSTSKTQHGVKKTSSYDTDLLQKELIRKKPKWANSRINLDTFKKAFPKAIATMVSYDPPEHFFDFILLRETPQRSLFAPNEIKMLEHIQPALFSAIRKHSLNMELDFLKNLSFSVLHDSSSPFAVFCLEGTIILANKPFYKLLNLESGEPIPCQLIEIVNEKLFNTASGVEPSFFNSSGNVLDLKFHGVPFQLSLIKWHNINFKLSRLVCLRQQKEKLRNIEEILSPKENEICNFLKLGLSSQEISEQLFISQHTVKNHLKSVYKKLNVNSRARLLAKLHNSPKK